jgi:protoporphyrinogen oxidase
MLQTSPVAAPTRADALVLGAGISGLVATRLLKRQGYQSIIVLDQYKHAGGNHISCDIGPYTFDIGTFLFQDDSPLMRHFPELLAAYHPASPGIGRVTPDGRILDYPMSIRSEILDAGIVEWLRIGGSLLRARLSFRPKRNVRDLLHYWIGPRLANTTGIENYISRFYEVPADKIEVSFALKRMEAIARAASIRNQALKLLGKKEPWHKGRSFVRPREGFPGLYQIAVRKLEAEGVRFRLGESFQALTREGNEFCLSSSGGTFLAETVVSTIPVDECLKLCGLADRPSLPTMTLTTLFFSTDGQRGFRPTILYNFSASGRWKRLTMYSDYYGSQNSRDYFGVELSQQSFGGQNRADEDSVDRCAEQFVQDVRQKDLFQGDLKLEGAYRLENAYPLYMHGVSSRANEAIATLRNFGIHSVGRQGGFDYLPTARHTTLVVEEALLGRRGPLDASADEGV